MSVPIRVRRAFTLVEVLIVVIALGVLTAIVVPQFSAASDDMRLSGLHRNLETVRARIEAYHVQHHSRYPTLAGFEAQLTCGTNADGTAGHEFGPYLPAIPANPFTGNNSVTDEPPGEGKGWYYNEDTGEFCANDSPANRAL